MKENPLNQLGMLGQSMWLDYIRRRMIMSGELRRLIEKDGLRGITSNPAIFEKAISGSHDYDRDVRVMALAEKDVRDIYQALSLRDVQSAADEFQALYDKTNGQDGYVSLEVNPHLAYDTKGTIEEARRLWRALDRRNVFIKVPATLEGLPAIRQLISEGINVNVTLLFGLPRYRQVAEAYMAGLEDRISRGESVTGVHSVASFFLSRIDVLVDPMLERLIKAGGRKGELATELHGEIAVASAKIAYQIYREITNAKRWKKLAQQGAAMQRLLWASTSTKNPDYSDVKYVEQLIGRDTITTLPLETLDAYRDHGNPKARLEDGVDKARDVLARLPELGIEIDAVTQQLENEGIQKFIKPFDQLLKTLDQEVTDTRTERVDDQQFALGGYRATVEKRLDKLEDQEFASKLWRKDATLWKADAKTQQQIRESLGWLHVAEKMESQLGSLADFVSEIQRAGFQHVVHMGMGGSSLAPLLFSRTFKPGKDGLPLTVLDTTDPATIRQIEHSVSVKDTLFIVASKSGTTAEPLAFGEYFYAQVKQLKGADAGENFVTITDPDSPLVGLARERGYRRSFLNFHDIGGRYSALSWFGLLPAGLMGLDVAELLARALRMSHACRSCVPAADNPGLVLGATLGELAQRKRDKVTLIMPPAIATFGLWLEQLLAESTGKEGRGVLPIATEPLGKPAAYGDDRLFIYLRLPDANPELEGCVAALREADQPVITIQLADRSDLGQEFFRWEVATATAGAVLGLNPFDQPNVQESKDNTNRLLEKASHDGALPSEESSAISAEVFGEFLAQAHPGDYLSLLAYLPETEATNKALQIIRVQLRDALKLATTVGYGPRYLHSTGQFHKGGPNSGLFVMLTADDSTDVAIPGKPFGFSVFKRAQALGDFEALKKHGQHVVRIHLSDVAKGLEDVLCAVQNTVARERGH